VSWHAAGVSTLQTSWVLLGFASPDFELGFAFSVWGKAVALVLSIFFSLFLQFLLVSTLVFISHSSKYI
jgi:hypothetical protein